MISHGQKIMHRLVFAAFVAAFGFFACHLHKRQSRIRGATSEPHAPPGVERRPEWSAIRFFHGTGYCRCIARHEQTQSDMLATASWCSSYNCAVRESKAMDSCLLLTTVVCSVRQARQLLEEHTPDMRVCVAFHSIGYYLSPRANCVGICSNQGPKPIPRSIFLCKARNFHAKNPGHVDRNAVCAPVTYRKHLLEDG